MPERLRCGPSGRGSHAAAYPAKSSKIKALRGKTGVPGRGKGNAWGRVQQPASASGRGTDERNPMSERTTLPVLPLRETVIFPGTAVPISAGRPGTLQAIEAALAGDRRMLAAAQ